MAAFDSTHQFERDLRSARKDYKRHKDASAKWAFGVRPLGGCHVDLFSGEAVNGAGLKTTKERPRQKYSNTHNMTEKDGGNIVKWKRTHSLLPASRVRSHCQTGDELDEAARLTTSELMLGMPYKNPVSAVAANISSSGFLYSFDNTDSPPPVLTLDAFVKPNVRATEKFIEKEYEVLDDNGQTVRGRKARQVLRQAAAGGISPRTAVASGSGSGHAPLIDDEDFELV